MLKEWLTPFIYECKLLYLPTTVILLSLSIMTARQGWECVCNDWHTLYPSPESTLHAQNSMFMLLMYWTKVSLVRVSLQNLITLNKLNSYLTEPHIARITILKGKKSKFGRPYYYLRKQIEALAVVQFAKHNSQTKLVFNL